MGVPVTTQACLRHRCAAIWAATLLVCDTSCASSRTIRQKPSCSSGLTEKLDDAADSSFRNVS